MIDMSDYMDKVYAAALAAERGEDYCDEILGAAYPLSQSSITEISDYADDLARASLGNELRWSAVAAMRGSRMTDEEIYEWLVELGYDVPLEIKEDLLVV